MQDNGSYNQSGGLNLVELVTALSQKFDGKNQNELLKAVYQEAEKGKRNGTLTNAQLDGFESMLSAVLDDKKRKLLHRVVKELKKI
ncbi:MAG: hypothetical protein IKB98_07950 [Clostridia bacterium]|nr:hypothetical protein [Clostridia bacterium]